MLMIHLKNIDTQAMHIRTANNFIKGYLQI